MVTTKELGLVRFVFLLFVLSLSACSGGGGSGNTTCAPGFYGANCTCQADTPITVNFRTMGTTQVPSLITADVLVTGSSDLGLLDLNGMGVVGGTNSYVVDGVEFLTFTFTAPVVDVSYYIPQAGNGDADGLVGEAFVEVMDDMGMSLGNFPVNGGGWRNVSDLVGGQEIISAFTATADVDFFQVSFLEYSLLVCP